MELNKENKAELLYGRLRDRIETMTEGESFPSVRQLMQEYQVSRFTVDPVLRKLREQGHLESVIGSGTFVRHPEIGKQPKLLILESDWPSPSIVPVDHREDFCRMLPALSADVVVANSLARDLLTADQVRSLVNAPVPCILCLNAARVDRVRFVNGNNQAAGMIVANYFFRHGHRQMAFLRTEPHGVASDDLIQGFRLAAGTFGCDVDVLDCGTKSGEDSSERTRGYLARNLNRLRKYSAIFVGSSMTAVAAMSFLAEHGIAVPEEISMLALGDVKIAGAERLSVAASARADIAREVLDMASDIVNRRFDRNFQVEISPRIIERGSVKLMQPGCLPVAQG